MTSILISFFKDEQCKQSIIVHDNLPKIIAAAICRILIRPKIELLTRGVSEEMTNSVKEILSFIRSSKPETQEVIAEFIGDVKSREHTLNVFL